MREKVAGNEEYEVNGETYQYGAAAYRLEDSITLSSDQLEFHHGYPVRFYTGWPGLYHIRPGGRQFH